jgi:hypothetical protein
MSDKEKREQMQTINISGNTFSPIKTNTLKMTKKQIAAGVVEALAGKLKFGHGTELERCSVEIAGTLYEQLCELHGLGEFFNRRDQYNSFSSALRGTKPTVLGQALERERRRLGYKK